MIFPIYYSDCKTKNHNINLCKYITRLNLIDVYFLDKQGMAKDMSSPRSEKEELTDVFFSVQTYARGRLHYVYTNIKCEHM